MKGRMAERFEFGGRVSHGPDYSNYKDQLSIRWNGGGDVFKMIA